ncbi:MAG: SRPBCC family protein [Verrucomicrobiota bacterium]
MIRIENSVSIHAPIGVVFDSERDIYFHTATQGHRGERAVDGVTSGLLRLGDEVEWEARHFGVRQRLRVRISEMTPPNYFKDEMMKGIFRTFSHEHRFSEISATETLKKDIIEFSAPLGFLGLIAERLFLRRYMRYFIQKKNFDFKTLIEKTNWAEQDAVAEP